MWNHTGQAIMLPNIDDELELLLQATEFEPQQSPLNFDPECLFAEENDLWKTEQDDYLCEILDFALNILKPQLNIRDPMPSKNFKKALQDLDTKKSTRKYAIIAPHKSLKAKPKPTKKFILPLSLENNGTTTGTTAILDDVKQNVLGIPSKMTKILPYDQLNSRFDLNKARNHYELTLTQEHHNEMMIKYNEAITSKPEKYVDIEDWMRIENKTTFSSERERFHLLDSKFNSDVQRIMTNYSKSRSNPSILKSSAAVLRSSGHVISLINHLKQTTLHLAVETQSVGYVTFLLQAGANINAVEGCGITPLTLATIRGECLIVEKLLSLGAKSRGYLYASMPSPMTLAKQLENHVIESLLEVHEAESDDEDGSVYVSTNIEKKPTQHQDEDSATFVPVFRRPGFVTPVVGDVGTCKTNASAMAWLESIYRL